MPRRVPWAVYGAALPIAGAPGQPLGTIDAPNKSTAERLARRAYGLDVVVQQLPRPRVACPPSRPTRSTP